MRLTALIVLLTASLIVAPVAGVGASSASSRIATDGLVVLNADGSDPWPLARGYEMPSYSPDGSSIAAVKEHEIWVLRASGREGRRLTSGFSPAWSPDGRQVAYDTFLPIPDSISVISADGTNGHKLVDALCAGRPSWSPDGTRIAFSSCGTTSTGPTRIWVANADGTDAHPVTSGPSDVDAAWSPDGEWIAFSVGHDVELVHPDGSGLRRVTGFTNAQAPAWSPDGGRLAFQSSGSTYVMSVGGVAELVAPSVGDPAWQPFTTAPPPGCSVSGADGGDALIGSAASDVICGSPGPDLLRGGGAFDVLRGGGGADRLVGGPGSDVIQAGAGNDVIDARDGSVDIVDGGQGHDAAVVDARDRVRNVERVTRPEPRNRARGRPVSASFSYPWGPPDLAVDGLGHGPALRDVRGKDAPPWVSAAAPQWIEIDLGARIRIRRIELAVAQGLAPRHTVHLVYGGPTPEPQHLLHTFAGETTDGDQLSFSPRRPWRRIRYLRVETLEDPFNVSWREIRVLS